MDATATPVRDVAAYLSVGDKTIYRLAQMGEMPGFTGVWRFQRADLDRWIAEQKRAAGPRQKQESSG